MEDLAFATHQVGAANNIARLRLLHAVPRHGVVSDSERLKEHHASRHRTLGRHGVHSNGNRTAPEPRVGRPDTGDNHAHSAAAPMPLCLARSHGSAQRFAAALAAHLRHNTGLQEMELAFSLPPRALSTLGDALPRAGCLRVISFAGSRLGDAGLMRLLDGLQSCVCLQSLSCARCELTDVGGQALAGLLREAPLKKIRVRWTNLKVSE